MVTFQLPLPDLEAMYSEESDASELRRYLPLLVDLDREFSQPLTRIVELKVSDRSMLWGDQMDEYHASSYYNEFIVPLRGHDMLCAATELDGEELPALVYLHHENRCGARFGSRGVRLPRLLHPAFEAGVRTFQRFGALRKSLMGMLDEIDGLCRT